jgi:hypothetical protein
MHENGRLLLEKAPTMEMLLARKYGYRPGKIVIGEAICGH